MRLSILYEDNHLLVIDKPIGLPTMGAEKGTPTLYSSACQYLKQKYHKPGNVYLGVVMRIDSHASGVVLFAKTSKAAGRLSQQFRERDAVKMYWAIVEKPPAEPSGEWIDWVAKDEDARRMRIVNPTASDSQQARLEFRIRQQLPCGTLLSIHLHSGRKHQIRVQLADRGMPILGDRKYGSKRPFEPDGIALHAALLRLTHPVNRSLIEWRAPFPDCWATRNVDVHMKVDQLAG